MRTSASYSPHSSSPLPFSALQDRYFDDELVAGERIGAPVRSSRLRRFLRTLLITGLILGAGYIVALDPAAWWQRAQWVGAQAGALGALLESKTASQAEPPTKAVPQRLARPESPEPAASALPEVQPLPPLVVDPNDPYQKRAEAVGLHPGLSRVLLARLSAADYRNAEHAINTAIAKTPDGTVFTWPRQRRPDLALFKVHFVRGVTPDCRRYVVTVAKDGWVTTALPMERCGANLRQAAIRK